ncbi:pyridoxamine 5'-phosphate oxidase family protein [Rhizobium sullae]|uniref:pyridoxamine 5'-phosphate oxidase family protein n=1 Tax=Rhizobium sullae TaxID=50338 RepID=UPI000B3634DE|nr:pyridoxamine 5'-phosphate oxidase family protein [Rhizobium sullae]
MLATNPGVVRYFRSQGGVWVFELREMSNKECVELLQRAHFGRIGCCREACPYIVPVYFAYESNTIYSFSLAGRKIEWMRDNPNVCFETEEHGGGRGWNSVIATGKFHELPDIEPWRAQRLHAWSLLQKYNDWWEIGALKPESMQLEATIDPIYYAINIQTLTGRSARPVEQR